MNFPDDHDYFPQSELLNALSQSQMEFKDDKAKVYELRHLGRWVVIGTGTAYCPRTDAILGQRGVLIGDYANQDEAETEAGAHRTFEDDEFRVEILAPILPKTTPPKPLDDTEIPF